MYSKKKSFFRLFSLSCTLFRRAAFLLIIINSLWLSGCHDDDHDPMTNRKVNEVIYEKMEEWYLWYNEMPSPGELNFDADPEEFYCSLLSEKDGKSGTFYSFIVPGNYYNPGENESSRYGMEYNILSLQVTYVDKQGPADRNGIKRGDVLKAVGGMRLNVDNVADVLASSSGETTFTVDRWNEEAGKREEMDIVLPGREMMYSVPIGLDTIYSGTNAGGVGYLYFREFVAGPDKSPDLYKDELKKIFTRYQAAGVCHLILDLRSNGGGDMSVCQLLCTMLAPPEAIGEVFLTRKYNDKREDEVMFFDLNDIEGGVRLDLEKLIVVVSRETASASELVIHCLKPYLGDRLQVVGTETYGKNVGMEGLDDWGIPWIPFPVTFYLLNSEGKCDYLDGLKPDVYIEEDFMHRIYPLGDRREVLLRKAMQTLGVE